MGFWLADGKKKKKEEEEEEKITPSLMATSALAHALRSDQNLRAEPIPGKALAKSRKVYFLVLFFKTLGLGGGQKCRLFGGKSLSLLFFKIK